MPKRRLLQAKSIRGVAERHRRFFGHRNRVELRPSSRNRAQRLEARVREGKLRAPVLKNYRANLSNHVLPTLGDRRLGDIGVQDVQALIDQLRASGKASYTVLNIRNALRSALALAKKERIIPFNPAGEVDAPTAQREREPVQLTVGQVELLVTAAKTVDDRNLIRFAANSGLRFSEAIALRWDDVRLEPGKERLLVSVQFYRGELVQRTKTRSSRRDVPLLPQAAEALRSQLRESSRPNPHGLFFPNTAGNHLHASNWNRREWTEIRAAAGLPEVHFHDLRSFFVSHVRASNLPLATTLALVGHSDERTHDGYTKLTDGAEAEARQKLPAFFEQTAGEESVGPE